MQEGVNDYVLVNHLLLMEYMLVLMCFMEASNQLIYTLHKQHYLVNGVIKICLTKTKFPISCHIANLL